MYGFGNSKHSRNNARLERAVEADYKRINPIKVSSGCDLVVSYSFQIEAYKELAKSLGIQLPYVKGRIGYTRRSMWLLLVPSWMSYAKRKKLSVSPDVASAAMSVAIMSGPDAAVWFVKERVGAE